MQKFMSHCTAFAFFYFEFEGNFWEQDPGACIWRGDLSEGFLCYKFGGLIPVFGGAYTLRGLFSEFCSSYGKISNSLNTIAPNVKSLARFKKSTSCLDWNLGKGKHLNSIAKLLICRYKSRTESTRTASPGRINLDRLGLNEKIKIK